MVAGPRLVSACLLVRWDSRRKLPSHYVPEQRAEPEWPPHQKAQRPTRLHPPSRVLSVPQQSAQVISTSSPKRTATYQTP